MVVAKVNQSGQFSDFTGLYILMAFLREKMKSSELWTFLGSERKVRIIRKVNKKRNQDCDYHHMHGGRLCTLPCGMFTILSYYMLLQTLNIGNMVNHNR